jgi:hypothetical protein
VAYTDKCLSENKVLDILNDSGRCVISEGSMTAVMILMTVKMTLQLLMLKSNMMRRSRAKAITGDSY